MALSKRVFKLISVEQGKTVVRYLTGSELAVIVAYVMVPSKTRHAYRELTESEIDAWKRKLAELSQGEGI